MKVLMITGDKNIFKEGTDAYARFELQKSHVDLHAVYWGPGALWPALPKGHFKVVTVQDPFWRGLFGMYVAKRLGAKLNVQVHTDLSVYGGVRHVLAQFVLGRADSVRVVSQKIKRELLQKGVKATISVLPVFVDLERFTNLAPKHHAGKNILWVGRFEEEKNPLLAIKVFKEVWKSNADTKLILLGAGSLQNTLRAHTSGLPVEMPGWHDPLEYYAVADVVLCTSVHESWGASIVEALAAGVPVVAPDVGVAKEAGANVVSNKELAQEVIKVLHSGERGQLTLHLLTKSEWTTEWKKTL
jgi:glycosyltransferase involved in cell wall biosynthesis